jgi:PQQ-like domain
MTRPLTFIVIIAFSAMTALARTQQAERVSPKEGLRTAVRSHRAQPASVSSQPSPVFKEPTLDELHDALRKHRNLHDEYLYIARIGNEQSVPLLLERLRLDYGASEPIPPPGMVYGLDCAQVHLVDALRYITNTDQGMYYPRWAAWWKANRHLPQHRWILDGFAAAGLQVVEPGDGPFGLELIELIGRSHDYRAFNARRQLAEARPELRAEWVARASESDHRFRRLGAIGVLSQIDTRGHEDLLRRLAADSDPEIRREALTTLNDRLRISLSAGATDARILKRTDKDNWIRSVSFAADLLVVAFHDGNVQAFDGRTFQESWSRSVFPGAGDHVLAAGDEVILAAREGGLLSLDQRGRALWRREAGDQSNRVLRLILRGDDIVVVRDSSLEQLDVKTGVTKSTIQAIDFIEDADSAQTIAFFVDGWGLRSVSNGTRPKRQLLHAQAVSVTRQSVCVTSGGSENRVTCLAPDTLSPQWTRPIAANGTWGHSVAPIQDESRVFVPTDSDLTAFRASDGSTLWTTRGGQESHGLIVSTSYGLLIQNSHYELELREPQIGEVRRVWPQIHGVACLAVHQQFAVVADFDGVLWLVDLSSTSGHL